MNERIRELAKQAGGHFSTHNLMSNPVQYRESIELWDDRIEKFAELLIRECVVQIGDAIPDTNCSASSAYKTAKLAATSRVKEHFGVE